MLIGLHLHIISMRARQNPGSVQSSNRRDSFESTQHRRKTDSHSTFRHANSKMKRQRRL